MGKNKVKLLAMLVVALCTNGVTYSAHAEEIQNTKYAQIESSSIDSGNESTNIYEESKVNEAMNNKDSDIEITSNWLTDEVAKQVNKKVYNLTAEDFAKVTKIDLHYSKIEDEIPAEISLMTNLQYLNLNYTRLKGEIPASLSKLTKLTYLDLGDNKLDEIDDSIIKNVKDGKYTYCDLGGNQFKLSDGWYYLKGKWYYFDKWGEQASGTKEINGVKYEFTDDGFVREGWENNSDGTRCYFDRIKGKITNSWQPIDGKWYYFDDQGKMQTGLQNINGKKYYLGTDGVMLTGFQIIDGKKYIFSNDGDMKFGWVDFNGKRYYTDSVSGQLNLEPQKVIDGQTYRFYSDGSLIVNGWNGNTYVGNNGQTVSISDTHSNTQFNLFKYLTDTNNRVSVHYRAIDLHGGDTSNNCVFFTSEALRRVGIDLPLGTCNTYDLEDKLEAMGCVKSYDLSQLKPGDIVLTEGYTHVFVFMGWASDGYAYVCDNQADWYDNKVLHLRPIYTETAMVSKSSHFFYFPY